MIFGKIIGTAVIFGSAFGLIMREDVELDWIGSARASMPVTSAFRARCVHAVRHQPFIGLVEVFMLFCSAFGWRRSSGIVTMRPSGDEGPEPEPEP